MRTKEELNKLVNEFNAILRTSDDGSPIVGYKKYQMRHISLEGNMYGSIWDGKHGLILWNPDYFRTSATGFKVNDPVVAHVVEGNDGFPVISSEELVKAINILVAQKVMNG